MAEKNLIVYAIVVTYNGMYHDWIQKCIDSLLKSSFPVSIIVIDNGSTDGSIDYIQQHYPNIDFQISPKNLGFGKANNIGIKRALEKGADYVLLLNQDAWVDTNTIKELVKQHEQHPEYGVFSPIHCNGKGDALDYRFSEYISPQKGCKLLSDLLAVDRQTSKVYEVDFVNAAAWLINKDCLRKVGGFSPMFYHYGEDINYCHRIEYHGMKSGIYPNVKVYHDRENKPNEKFFTDEESEKRRYLIKMLNPNAPLKAGMLIERLLRNAIKLLVTLRFKACLRSIMNVYEIKKNRKQIQQSLKDTSENQQFVYIKD